MIVHWVSKISKIFVSNYLFAETYIRETNLIPYVCNHRYEVFIRTFWSVDSKWSTDVSICNDCEQKLFVEEYAFETCVKKFWALVQSVTKFWYNFQEL